MSKNNKINAEVKLKESVNDEFDVNEVEENSFPENYSYKWVDENTYIDIEDIKRTVITHDGSGEFVIYFYSKTDNIPFEIKNKYFDKIEDVRYFIYLIFQTYDLDVFDFNYFKEHPEEFQN